MAIAAATDELLTLGSVEAAAATDVLCLPEFVDQLAVHAATDLQDNEPVGLRRQQLPLCGVWAAASAHPGLGPVNIDGIFFAFSFLSSLLRLSRRISWKFTCFAATHGRSTLKGTSRFQSSVGTLQRCCAGD